MRAARFDIQFAGQQPERITLPSELIAVHTFRETDGGTTLADKLTAIAAQINASTAGATVTAEAAGSVLTITGRAAGESFGVEVTDPLVSDETFRTVVTPAVKGETVAAWEYCGPPSYHAVRATERLTKEDAIERARASVYRCYRVRFVDLETGKPPLSIPGYGPLKRRQQIILEPTKVEQVLPEPREPGRRLDTQAPLGFGKPPDYYNGYSRDEGASVYGSYSSQIGNVIWDGGFGNSPADGKVYVPFSIDPYEQVVTFSEPVFELPAIASGSRYQKPTLLLETSVLVLDPDTDAPVRYTRERRIGGAGPPEWVVAEDAQVGVVAEYAAGGRKVQATTHVDRDDADRRADRYLDGMQLKYQLKGGETRQYIGIYPIDPDGLVQQVTWTLGGGGPGTTASTNHEHSVDVLPYPVRRRAENLPPNASAAVANIAEQDKLSKAGLLGSIGLGGRVLRGLR